MREAMMNDNMTVIANVHRHRTALTRYSLSTPMRSMARYGYLDGQWSVFDYGCGKGGDLEILARNGVPGTGWDPHYRPEGVLKPAEIVNLGFVLNVIEDPKERQQALRAAYELAGKVLAVSAMLHTVASGSGDQFSDGVLTARGTFQKYYTQEELEKYISSTLGEVPVAVAPGLFFVFKDKEEEQKFFALRQRNRSGLDRLIQRIPKPTRAERERAFYERNRTYLDGLWEQWLTSGRPPREDEVQGIAGVRERLGSLKRALAFLKRFHGDEAIQLAAASRKDDLRVFFALLEFEHRRPYRSFPEDLRRDVRDLFSSMQQARREATSLLYSAGDAELVEAACMEAVERGLGVLDGDKALTLHTSLVSQLPALLRVYIGCASKLYGDVASADLLKVHTRSGKLTLMSFDDFDSGALPRMAQRVKVDLKKQRVDLYEYGDSYEKPHLYWKSQFISGDHPRYDEQCQFDKSLAALRVVDFEGYGPQPAELQQRLRAYRIVISGFRLKPIEEPPNLDDPCGQYLTFRQLLGMSPGIQEDMRLEPWVYATLGKCVASILDPVMDYFGGLELTGIAWTGTNCRNHTASSSAEYGIGAPAHVFNAVLRGRKGLAVGFVIPDESMLEVASWIAEGCQFNRMVVAGDHNSLTVGVTAVGGQAHDERTVGELQSTTRHRVIWKPTADWLASSMQACTPVVSQIISPADCQIIPDHSASDFSH